MKIAVVGTGIAGMACAWMLSRNHDVTVFEKDDRPGGHTNTVSVDGKGVDTGFIVCNDRNYPNLLALFDHIGVPIKPTDMSFGVSLNQGNFEYSGSDMAGMLAQKRNVFRPHFWKMMMDLLRFYKEAPSVLDDNAYESMTLGDYLKINRYNDAFINDHLVPMGAAIWSTPDLLMMDYPVRSFVQFCVNHGLLQINDRPQWYVVEGGSIEYLKKLTHSYSDAIHLNTQITSVSTTGKSVTLEDRRGDLHTFDHVVLACHADQSLSMLDNAESSEQRLLGAFKYQPNKAILHSDESLMPKRKGAWSSWNYLRDETGQGGDELCLTYWMNKLQSLEGDKDYFVTLNPDRMPQEGSIIRSFLYHHPLFDRKAVAAQRMLWNIQGQRRIWYCGSYFGHGFHEDALQSALVVAETLGGEARPWSVEDQNSRIHLPSDWDSYKKQVAA